MSARVRRWTPAEFPRDRRRDVILWTSHSGSPRSRGRREPQMRGGVKRGGSDEEHEEHGGGSDEDRVNVHTCVDGRQVKSSPALVDSRVPEALIPFDRLRPVPPNCTLKKRKNVAASDTFSDTKRRHQITVCCNGVRRVLYAQHGHACSCFWHLVIAVGPNW